MGICFVHYMNVIPSLYDADERLQCICLLLDTIEKHDYATLPFGLAPIESGMNMGRGMEPTLSDQMLRCFTLCEQTMVCNHSLRNYHALFIYFMSTYFMYLPTMHVGCSLSHLCQQISCTELEDMGVVHTVTHNTITPLHYHPYQ